MSGSGGEVVEFGAEQVSFSFSVFWCRLVTVELRETTFFRLDAFFATLESMLLDEVLTLTTEDNVDITKKTREKKCENLQHSPLCDS